MILYPSSNESQSLVNQDVNTDPTMKRMVVKGGVWAFRCSLETSPRILVTSSFFDQIQACDCYMFPSYFDATINSTIDKERGTQLSHNAMLACFVFDMAIVIWSVLIFIPLQTL